MGVLLLALRLSLVAAFALGVAGATGQALLGARARELAPLLGALLASVVLLARPALAGLVWPGGTLLARTALHLLPALLLTVQEDELARAAGVALCLGLLAGALSTAQLAPAPVGPLPAAPGGGAPGGARRAGALLLLLGGLSGAVLGPPVVLDPAALALLPGRGVALGLAVAGLAVVWLAAGRGLLALTLLLPALPALGLSRAALGAGVAVWGPLGPAAAVGLPWLLALVLDGALLALAPRLAARRGLPADPGRAARAALSAALLAAPAAALVGLWPALRPLAPAAPLALLAGALLGPLLVGPPARLLLAPGLAGAPGPREVVGALYTLLYLVGGGVGLLGRLRRLPEAGRERVALDGLHALAAGFVRGLPIGRRRLVAPPELPTAVYVANHESIYDVMALLALPVPLTILVKEWVWRRPVLGPVVQAAGYHLTDGADPRVLGERVRAGLARGVSVLVFPEGGRSRDGRLGRFHNGAFLLAREAGVPVVPVALVATREVVRAGAWWVGDHDAQAVVLEPLPASAWEGDLPDRAAARAARERIRAARDARWLEVMEGPRWREALRSRWYDQGPLTRLSVSLALRSDPLLAALPRLAWGEEEALVVGPQVVVAARLLQGHPERPVRLLAPDAAGAARLSAVLAEPGRATVLAGDPRQADLGRPGFVALVDALSRWPQADQPAVLAALAGALPAGARALFRDRCAGRGARPATEWARLLNAAGLAVESTRPELGRRWQVAFLLRRA